MYKVVWGVIGFLILVFVTWAVHGNDFFLYQFWAPKYEAARRQTFEESKAYNDGMAQELAAAQLDYAKAGKDERAAMRSVLLHRYASYDKAKLPLDLQVFVAGMQHDQAVGQ